MEFQIQNYLRLCLVFLFFPCNLECLGIGKVNKNGGFLVSDSSSQLTATANDLSNYSRKGKQFLFPVMVWPHTLGTFLPSTGTDQLLPFLLLQPQSDNVAHIIATQQVRDGKFSHEKQQKFSSHAIYNGDAVTTSSIPCNTKDNELGICKPFTECFPMMELQYGNANYIDYQEVPLAEQMIISTNSSTCSQSETVHENLKVCCPHPKFESVSSDLQHGDRSYTNGNFHDEVAHTPEITQRPPPRNVISRRMIDEQKCGKSQLKKSASYHPQGKITGGQEATGPYEFPWMVAVFGKNRKIFCGASLITEQFLISAAHCFSTFKPEDVPHLYVHLGDFNIKTTADGPHEVRKIDKIIINKRFNINNYHNDIALLKLDKPVNFTDRISPICLPDATMDTLEQRQIIVTGWGRKYRYGTTSDVLRKVVVPVWNLQECKNLYSRFAPGRVLDTNLCAGDGKRNKDACLGDSGGPAVMFDGNKYVLVGITSWGKGCGSFPGVYTRTSRFLMWITKNLNQFS